MDDTLDTFADNPSLSDAKLTISRTKGLVFLAQAHMLAQIELTRSCPADQKKPSDRPSCSRTRKSLIAEAYNSPWSTAGASCTRPALDGGSGSSTFSLETDLNGMSEDRSRFVE
jgi:hypothetical protein